MLTSIHATGADGKPTGPSLEPLIQFGWLTIIAKPLYLALRFLHMSTAFPTGAGPSSSSPSSSTCSCCPRGFMMMKSSLKMMRIQPKVDALKKRYAHLKMNDPKRAEMNTEMMALYKTRGREHVRRLPAHAAADAAVLRLLSRAGRTRWSCARRTGSGSPISPSPDPLHILPILIIVSMFLVQFITPSPGMDPNAAAHDGHS